MSQEYISQNSGLLTVSNVKDGDKLVIVEDAYSTFSEAKQKTYWNAKVKLPDNSVKLAGLMEMSCDKFLEKWGKNTGDWTGHTVQVSIKTSKAGNPYIVLEPTDDPIVDVISEQIMNPEKTIEYPVSTSGEIKSDDIPF